MRFLLIVLLLGNLCGAARAETGPKDWEFRLTPYLWLPVIDGTLKYSLPPGGSGSPDVEVGPTDWLDLLNFGALLNGSARKGRFSLFSDLVYLSMTSKNEGRVLSVGTEDGPIPIGVDLNLDTRSDLDGLLWTITAGYSLQQTQSSSLDVFAGVRYLGVDVSTSWDLSAEITGPMGETVLPAEGSIGSDEDLWDGIVGIRGRAKLGAGGWSLPYYLDVGTGSSDLTWNAMAGFSYAFGWGDLVIAYRHLGYDQDADSLLKSFSFSGPAVGATFRF